MGLWLYPVPSRCHSSVCAHVLVREGGRETRPLPYPSPSFVSYLLLPLPPCLSTPPDFLSPHQVRYIGVSNETSYGVMRFVEAAERYNLPKIVSIQNCYHLIRRLPYESE